MSSPSLRKKSTSPIRSLDDKSPKRGLSPKRAQHLQTILEEESYIGRQNGLTSTYQRSSSFAGFENRMLHKPKSYADDPRQAVENSRLRKQNQLLKEKNYISSTIQNDRLKRELILKDAECDKLREDILILKNNYDLNLEHFSLENQSLKKQLLVSEEQRSYQSQEIKNRIAAMAEQDINIAKKTYLNDLNSLITNLDSTKAILAEKQLEIKHLTIHSQNLMKEHSIYLEQLVSDNNILRNQILQIELKTENEIKQAENKRQLQKSRTHGIITFAKESNAYMQKQINNLAEELLEKNISIQQFTRDILKIRKNLEQTEKKYEEKLDKVEQQCAQKVRDMEKQVEKHEKYHKQEIADLKKYQIELQEKISTQQNLIENSQRQIGHLKQIISSRGQEIDSLKNNISRLHEDHVKEINKVMSDTKLKRRSMKNLSEVSSLRDLSVDGNNSSIVKRFEMRRSNSGEYPQPVGQQHSRAKLSTVQEELANSQLIPSGSPYNIEEEEQDLAMKELVQHYETVIQELKNNKALELNLANQTINKLNVGLRQKQQEVLDILERFSPLMEYKMNSVNIETERKEKIERHYRANVDLLSVMLDKYSIAALSKNK